MGNRCFYSASTHVVNNKSKFTKPSDSSGNNTSSHAFTKDAVINSAVFHMIKRSESLDRSYDLPVETKDMQIDCFIEAVQNELIDAMLFLENLKLRYIQENGVDRKLKSSKSYTTLQQKIATEEDSFLIDLESQSKDETEAKPSFEELL